MPGPWRKLKDFGGYARLRPNGGCLRVWPVSSGRALKVWKYSVVGADGKIEEAGVVSTMKAARTAAEKVNDA